MGMEELDKDIIRLHFEESLSLHGEVLADVLAEQIERKRLMRSGELLESIMYDVTTFKDAPMLEMSFKMYGRMVDRLGYRKSKHEVNINRDIWGIKENRPKKKNLKWYARYMYHDLYKLISRLSYGLGEDELERLKGILEKTKNLLN